ncbi:MAG TPA: hypothetical protein VHG51_06155 [Longimicrobiaceae bacterium]|nr:hypothetical protein [Longimicrobiaceae bacterium]
MTRPRVYVESTIQSLYFEIRSSPDMIARREWTRQWWAVAADRYSLVTSPAVLDELAGGDAARSAERLELVRDPAIDEIREVRQRISARFAHDPRVWWSTSWSCRSSIVTGSWTGPPTRMPARLQLSRP